MPTASIVIRTFNEEQHLGNLLRAIGEQNFKDYEIIIVDSGSTDKTLDIARQFKTTVFQIANRDFTFGYALNVGCKVAKGKYLVFASAHVLPTDKQWLEQLIAPLADPKVAMVYGRQMADPGAKFSEKRDLARLFGPSAFDSRVVLDYANNANSAVRKELWLEHSFDEYLFGLEDIDWARWATARGNMVHYAPKAAVYHIHREAWHQVFNRYRREAIAAARIGLPHPPQSRIEFSYFLWNLLTDVMASFPIWSPARLEEILRFRYYQWKGGRQGWLRDKHLDLDRDKFSLFRPDGNHALVIRGPGRASLEDRAMPQLLPGDLLVQVSYVGICHTDLEVYEGTLGYYRQGIARYPIVPGHEFSGIIVQVGANNKYRERFPVGQKVVGECIISRDPNSRQEVGVVNHDGACAKFVVVPGDHVHKIENELDLQTAALAEPLAVVLRALRRVDSRLKPGMHTAVVGAGPIGNLCAQVLASRGFQAAVFDRKSERLGFLEGFDVRNELNGLDQFDVIIEATGSSEALERVLAESRMDAALLLLGFPYGKMEYNFEDLVGREQAVIGSVGADPQDFVEALKLLPALNTGPFTRAVLPLGSFEEAWNLHRSGKELKIMLTPSER